MSATLGGSRRTLLGRALGPLRVVQGNRSVARLVAGFCGLTIAEWGYVTALAVEAFERNGTIAVGLVGLRLFVGAVSSVVTVPIVERRAGMPTLTVIAGLRAVIVGSSALLAASGAPLAPLLVLVAVDAVVAAPYRPAQSALLPLVARTPAELAASAAGLSTVKTVSQALGAAAGGSLLAVTTPSVVFTGVAILFAVVAVDTVSFRQPEASRRAGVNSRFGPVGDTFRLVRDQHVSGIMLVSGLRTFVRGMWVSIAVIVSLRLLDAGSAGVGLLMLAAGIGSVTAVPLASALVNRARLGTPAAVALIACGVPLALVAGAPALQVAVVLVAAWGVGMAVADVTTVALLFRLLETPLLPRATSAIESAKLALEGLGGFLGPVLVVFIGVRGSLLVAALPLPIVVVVGWKVLHRVDDSAGERQRLLGLLHNTECFRPLDIAALEALAGRVKPLSLPGDADIIIQGDSGDLFYILTAGSADVIIDGARVGRVDTGASFGEIALLDDCVRTATIRSREAVELLALSREDFLAGLDLTADALALRNGQRVAPSRVDSLRDQERVLSNVGLFAHLDSGTLRSLAERAVVETWGPGESIVRQGEDGDRFFVLVEGRASVRIDGEEVRELSDGEHFGEIALLDDVARAASVITSTAATTLSLQRDDFVPAVRERVLRG